MSDFFASIVKELKDENTTIASDGKGSAEFSCYVDTGSLMLNALLSGSLNGGMPNNKVICLAGESTTGKTFMALGIVKAFLDIYPDGGVLFSDTESAVTVEMMKARGINPDRVVIMEPETVEDFRTKMMKFLNAYGAKPKAERPPLLAVLDSIGQLSTEKEVGDITEGKNTRDMTRAQVIRGAFRSLRLKMSKLGVPLVMTNHIYQVVTAYVPTQEMSGGGGVKFAADYILFLRKSKEKDEKTKKVVGVNITVTTVKSRLSQENQSVEIFVSYKDGLDRYSGLLDFAVKHGVVLKINKGNKGTHYAYNEKVVKNVKDIAEVPAAFVDNEPGVFFYPIMDHLEEIVRREFSYGTEVDDVDDEENGHTKTHS